MKVEEITPTAIDDVLACGSRWPSFPFALEQRFEAETSRARCRHLTVAATVGLVLMNLFLVHDYLSLPDVFGLAVVLRTFVSTSYGLLVLWALSRNPHPMLREGLGFGLALIGAFSILVLMHASESESDFRQEYQYGVMLVVLFSVVLLRLRFPFALASAGAILSMQVGSAIVLPQSAPLVEFGRSSIIVGTILFALIASYQTDRSERRAYLRGLKARLRADEFEAMSLHDPLTGLGNRRSLDRVVRRLTETTDNVELSILVVDVDHFKKFNDMHGHLAGDECLQDVARSLRASVESSGGSAYRFGGEEFLVLLPGQSLASAGFTAERLRRAVEQLSIRHGFPRTGSTVSVSVGVAHSVASGSLEFDDLLERADRALFAAKGRGRNVVGMDGDHEIAPVRQIASTA